MIRLHERQLAMLVLHFCLRYTIQCITRVQQGPQSSILFRMGPHQIVPSQALLSQSDTASMNKTTMIDEAHKTLSYVIKLHIIIWLPYKLSH